MMQIQDSREMTKHSHTPLCLVFDLNGTLLAKRTDLMSKYTPTQDSARPHKWKGVVALRYRPHLDDLLEYVFEEAKCEVVVWTFSGNRKNARSLMRGAFGKYADRVQCLYTKADVEKRVKGKKDLNMVWSRFPSWDHDSTVLIEDSPDKTTLQPENAVIVKTFKFGAPEGDTELLTLIQTLRDLQHEREGQEVKSEDEDESEGKARVGFAQMTKQQHLYERVEGCPTDCAKAKPRHRFHRTAGKLVGKTVSSLHLMAPRTTLIPFPLPLKL